MAEMNFGGVIETVVTSKEFSLEKAREVLKDEVIAVIGYGIQGPGQACNLRDNYDALLSNGFAIVGASIQSEASHKKFIEKYDLPFPIIADTDKGLVETLGVYGEKKMCGKVGMGTFRTTFITDENGVVTEIIGPKQVKVKEHAQQILK